MSAATEATNSTVSAASLAIKTAKNIFPLPKVTLTSLTANNVGTLRTLNNAIFPISYSDRYYADVLESSMENFNKIIYYSDIPVGSITCRVEPSLPPIDDATSTPPLTPPSTPAPPLRLHILTINVLPAYRSQSLGSHLIAHVLSSASTFTWPPPPSPAAAVKPADATPPAAADPPASATPAKKPKGKDNKAAAKAAAVVAQKKKALEQAKKAEEDKKRAEEEKKQAELEEQRIAALRRLEAVFVHCQVGNEEAKRFYLKNGFEEKSTITNYYHDKDIGTRDAIMFEKRV